MNVLKSVFFVFGPALLLIGIFNVNVIRPKINRGPAIEHSEFSNKKNVKAFILAMYSKN